jgi:hypothetical protein
MVMLCSILDTQLSCVCQCTLSEWIIQSQWVEHSLCVMYQHAITLKLHDAASRFCTVKHMKNTVNQTYVFTLSPSVTNTVECLILNWLTENFIFRIENLFYYVRKDIIIFIYIYIYIYIYIGDYVLRHGLQFIPKDQIFTDIYAFSWNLCDWEIRWLKKSHWLHSHVWSLIQLQTINCSAFSASYPMCKSESVHCAVGDRQKRKTTASSASQ